MIRNWVCNLNPGLDFILGHRFNLHLNLTSLLISGYLSFTNSKVNVNLSLCFPYNSAMISTEKADWDNIKGIVNSELKESQVYLNCEVKWCIQKMFSVFFIVGFYINFEHFRSLMVYHEFVEYWYQGIENITFLLGLK